MSDRHAEVESGSATEQCGGMAAMRSARKTWSSDLAAAVDRFTTQAVATVVAFEAYDDAFDVDPAKRRRFMSMGELVDGFFKR